MKGLVEPNEYYIKTSSGNNLLQCVDSTSDLGIIIENNLKSILRLK